MGKKKAEVDPLEDTARHEIDQDVVAKLVIGLERKVDGLKQSVATDVTRMQQEVAAASQRLQELTKRFDGIREEWETERKRWREKGRVLDDAILDTGSAARKTREDMAALRQTMELIRLPQDLVKPMQQEIGKLTHGLTELRQSLSAHDERLRKELRAYVPEFRNKGRQETPAESTWTPIADQKEAEEKARVGKFKKA